ncbi:MAG: DNA-3-methyladenine glycosylase [Planctomycetota bacterium]
MPALPRRFFARPADELAPALLGHRLIRTEDDGSITAGLIVETEAYLGVIDKAAHTYGGHRSPRVESMYARPGTAYVYFTYGMHHCLNASAAAPGDPQAVLIRAIEPTDGLDRMRDRRPAARRDRDLTSGPAKLCQALGVDRDLDGVDLASRDSPLRIVRATASSSQTAPIVTGPRIGIASAEDWADRPLRFWLHGHPCVSRTPAGKSGMDAPSIAG